MALPVMDEAFCDETFVPLASSAGIGGPQTYNLNEDQSSINTVDQKLRALMLAKLCNEISMATCYGVCIVYCHKLTHFNNMGHCAASGEMAGPH